MAVPGFFLPLPPYYDNWQISNTGAGGYGFPALVPTNQIAGVTGSQRYLQSFTIPTGFSGVFVVTVQGDIHEGVCASGQAQVWYDGVQQLPNVPCGGVGNYTFPIVPGPHTFELFIGGAPAIIGQTSPQISVVYGPFTNTIDCGCCVIEGRPICFAGSPSSKRALFQSVVFIQNPNGLSGAFLPTTINGDIRGQGGGLVTGGPGSGGVILEYEFANPVDLVESIEIYLGQQTAAGADVNNSGFISSDYEVYNATGNLIASGALNVANLANNLDGSLTSFLPLLLRNVKRVRLLNMVNVPGQSMQWREFLAWARPIRSVSLISCNGVVSLVDPVTGLGVNEADIVDCNASTNTVSVPPPPLTNFAAHFSGLTLASPANQICNVVPTPDILFGFVGPPPCYTHTGSTPAFTWNGPISDITLEYGGNGQLSDNASVYFQDSGGTYNFAFGPKMNPGESIVSLNRVDGRKIKFTYLTGPSSAISPQPIGANLIQVQTNATPFATLTQPIRFKVTRVS